MSIATVAAAQAAQAASGSSADKAASSLSTNYEMFLTLLTTQLKNQDPTDPMKSAEFTSQLVQYSSVEQQIKTNKNLESLLTANMVQAMTTSVSLLGKQVNAVGTGATLKDGEANWSYTLATDAPTTSIQVLDAKGAAVYQKTIEGKEGAQSFSWDGKDANGVEQPEGTYFISIAAQDGSGQVVNATTSVKGTVTAVDMSVEDPLLTVNGAQIRYSDVRSVSQP